jgi:hypothetical protein
MSDAKEIEQLLKSIVKVETGKNKRTKQFPFKLIELFLYKENIKKSKITNAKTNMSHWDKDGIQFILMKALERSFDAFVEVYKGEKPEDINTGEYCIRVKHLEFYFSSLGEDRKELSDQIDKLEGMLEGKGMMSLKEYKQEKKVMSEEINLKDEEIKTLRQKLEDREKYYKIKIASADKRAYDKLSLQKKIHETPPHPPVKETILEY